MSAPIRAARARLRTPSASHRSRIENALAELNTTKDTLLAAASGLYVVLKQGMVKHRDVYELLRVIHLRLKQTISETERAALNQDGAA
jgi:hypothetical protein